MASKSPAIPTCPKFPRSSEGCGIVSRVKAARPDACKARAGSRDRQNSEEREVLENIVASKRRTIAERN